ncbi:MAG: response regulator [Pseudomonadota bacterium]|jgi:two-component system response regulator|nr:response regulator [Pseudomonadota bacterium]
MSNLAEARPVEILLVEDNPGDVLLTQEAFKRAKIRNNLVVAPDGEVALKILAKEEGYEDAKTPDLILLDLNLPKFNGKEVLEKVKSSDKLKRIPIVVLSSSKAEQDINQSYDLHANSYVTKPIDIQKLAAIVQSIESFWFSVVQLPK